MHTHHSLIIISLLCWHTHQLSSIALLLRFIHVHPREVLLHDKTSAHCAEAAPNMVAWHLMKPQSMLHSNEQIGLHQPWLCWHSIRSRHVVITVFEICQRAYDSRGQITHYNSDALWDLSRWTHWVRSRYLINHLPVRDSISKLCIHILCSMTFFTICGWVEHSLSTHHVLFCVLHHFTKAWHFMSFNSVSLFCHESLPKHLTNRHLLLFQALSLE